MKVVVKGAWTRGEAEDFELVNKLLDKLFQQYPGLYVISAGCDRGIGKIVKNRCMAKEQNQNPEFDFAEVAIRIYASNAPKAVMAQFWKARNKALFDIGEEFHLFMEKETAPSGEMQDLLDLVIESGRPYSLYHPGDKEPKLIKI